MSHSQITRAFTVVACLVAMVGCGGPIGLNAEGVFNVATPTFETGINLTQLTRIDAGGLVTGSCTITESIEGRSVSVDLFTNAGGADNQLRRASIVARTGSSSGVLTAEVGTTTYSAPNCNVAVDLIDLGGSTVLSTVGVCTLTAADSTTVDANVELAVHGCRVIYAE